MNGIQAFVCVLLIVIFAGLSSFAIFEHNSHRHRHAAFIWVMLTTIIVLGVLVIIAAGMQPPSRPLHTS